MCNSKTIKVFITKTPEKLLLAFLQGNVSERKT